MRDLRRNQIEITYRLYIKSEEVIDKDGYATGDHTPIFGEETPLEISVSANKGEYSEQMFGDTIDYDRTMIISDPKCPINENARITIDGELYTVKGVARSLNATQYAIKRIEVTADENNGEALGEELEEGGG